MANLSAIRNVPAIAWGSRSEEAFRRATREDPVIAATRRQVDR